MKHYTFFFYGPIRPIPSFEIAECADDEEARSRAPQLAQTRPDCRKLEVWDEAKLVHQVSWAEPAGEHAGAEGGLGRH